MRWMVPPQQPCSPDCSTGTRNIIAIDRWRIPVSRQITVSDQVEGKRTPPIEKRPTNDKFRTKLKTQVVGGHVCVRRASRQIKLLTMYLKAGSSPTLGF